VIILAVLIQLQAGGKPTLRAFTARPTKAVSKSASKFLGYNAPVPRNVKTVKVTTDIARRHDIVVTEKLETKEMICKGKKRKAKGRAK